MQQAGVMGCRGPHQGLSQRQGHSQHPRRRQVATLHGGVSRFDNQMEVI